MSDQFPPVSSEVTSDDKLWAALGYLFWPIAILLLLMEDKKQRKFIKLHAIHALVVGVIISLLSAVTVGIGCITWLVMLYLAYKAYQGTQIEIPLLTKFIRDQGWVN
jgi:uncharacterized membrane protein